MPNNLTRFHKDTFSVRSLRRTALSGSSLKTFLTHSNILRLARQLRLCRLFLTFGRISNGLIAHLINPPLDRIKTFYASLNKAYTSFSDAQIRKRPCFIKCGLLAKSSRPFVNTAFMLLLKPSKISSVTLTLSFKFSKSTKMRKRGVSNSNNRLKLTNLKLPSLMPLTLRTAVSSSATLLNFSARTALISDKTGSFSGYVITASYVRVKVICTTLLLKKLSNEACSKLRRISCFMLTAHLSPHSQLKLPARDSCSSLTASCVILSSLCKFFALAGGFTPSAIYPSKGEFMSNFNKRFNNLCARVNFWFNLTQHLAGSEQFLKAQGHLTPEDVKALNLIHHGLAECYKTANERLLLHKEKLYSLRKKD